MKKGYTINILLFISVIMFCFILAVGFADQNHKWKGQVKTINGINYVMNPKEPILDEMIFDLKEEYNIRSTDEIGKYVLNKPSRMLLDEHDNLYILDPAEGNVKIFDSQGRFLRIIGRKGQGPGELNVPSFFSLLNRDELVIADAGRRCINIYSLNGEYKRSVSTAKMVVKDMDVDSKGNIFCIVQTRSDDHLRYELEKFDSSFTQLNTFRQNDDHISIKPSLFVASPCLVVSRNSHIIYGFPDKDYELEVFDDNGILLKRIQKDFAHIPISDEEKRDVIKDIPGSLEIYIPEYYPPYYDINVDDEARIIVYSQYQYRTKISIFDVFTAEGMYLSRIKLRNILRPESCVWRKNRLYTIEEDSEGLPLVVVYQMKWKY